MGVHDYTDLINHEGHHIECVTYIERVTSRITNVAVECTDCCEVLMDFDNPELAMEMPEV